MADKQRSYARSNIFVGKYKLPADGWLRLPDAHVIYMLQLPSEHAFLPDTPENRRLYPDAPRWFILEDGDFWPVMIQLDPPDPGADGGA